MGLPKTILGSLALALSLLAAGGPVAARPPRGEDPPLPDPGRDGEGIFVLDGSYVHNIGELQLNITNWGLIGSRPNARASYSDAPSVMWPAGSGVEYLYGAGLWVGGIVEGQPLVSTGYPAPELLPSNKIEDTIYRMREGEPHGRRFPDGDGDDDGDGEVDEDPKDAQDNDGDGLVDEDYGAIGDQEFRCVMRDDTPLAIAQNADHDPLGIEVVQESYQWSTNELKDAVVLSFLITNRGDQQIGQPWVGFYVDGDVGPREGVSAPNQDDIVEFYTGLDEDGQRELISTPGHGRAWLNMAVISDCVNPFDERTTGYMGVMFLKVDSRESLEGDHVLDSTQIRSFRWFAGTSAYDYGGDPTNDAERYDALSGGQIQASPELTGDCRFANDYRFLISAPLPGLPRGLSRRVTIAIVMGESIPDLKRNAAEVLIAYWGDWFDKDRNPYTGYRGRERYACRTDYGNIPDSINPLFRRPQDCPNPDNPFQRNIHPNWLDSNGCIWINDDCFFEEARGPGLDCWSQMLDSDGYIGCTGVQGREYNVRWYVGSRPPVPPNLRVWETHDRVHLFWDNLSEYSLDSQFGLPQFEGYRIWRAAGWDRPAGSSLLTGPPTELWSAVGEYDVVDSFEFRRSLPAEGEYVEVRPLGANTGLEPILYTPAVLRADSYEASQFRELRLLLEQIYEEQPELDAETQIRYLDLQGEITPLGLLYPRLRDWECCYDQLDTLQADHFGTRWYEFVDRGLLDGFHYFHGVSATSKLFVARENGVVVAGLGQEGVPQTNFVPTMPSSYAQTREERAAQGAQIYVVPNPATHTTLDDFSALHPNSEDPTGRRVEFRNLPRARSIIRIFTLAGDLVAEVEHDGRGGDGSASWNLVSRNGQQVVSGIYLYSVESEDSAFHTFVGRLTLIL